MRWYLNRFDRPLIEEAVRLLDISDEPGLYRKIRRWAREHIKHLENAPIDTIFWPKGTLMCGLMHKARILKTSDLSADRAASVYAMSSVQSYLDRWIMSECPVHYIDDCMAGCALLMLAETYRVEEVQLHDKYLKSAGIMADYLKSLGMRHDAIPYRPAQNTGTVFADGIGMMVPFLVRYGLMNSDDDAIELGLRQVQAYMECGLEESTKLPLHFWQPDENEAKAADTSDEGGNPAVTPKEARLSASGNGNGPRIWGRAVGWVIYGLGAAYEALSEYGAISPMEIKALNEIHGYLVSLKDAVLRYRRPDRLFGSIVNDPGSKPDTSASAMIIYGLSMISKDMDISPIEPYIRSSGRVEGAQGECLGPGIYSEEFGSYPWSVGMTLLL